MIRCGIRDPLFLSSLAGALAPTPATYVWSGDYGVTTPGAAVTGWDSEDGLNPLIPTSVNVYPTHSLVTDGITFYSSNNRCLKDASVDWTLNNGAGNSVWHGFVVAEVSSLPSAAYGITYGANKILGDCFGGAYFTVGVTKDALGTGAELVHHAFSPTLGHASVATPVPLAKCLIEVRKIDIGGGHYRLGAAVGGGAFVNGGADSGPQYVTPILGGAIGGNSSTGGAPAGFSFGGTIYEVRWHSNTTLTVDQRQDTLDYLIDKWSL